MIADPAAEGQGVGDDTYHASIQGIGNYTGTYSGDELTYKLVKGKLENCTVMASSATYNRHAQNSPDVVLLDSGKVRIDPDQYCVVSVNNGSDCVNPGSYPVAVEAAEDGNYEGTATGEYAIAMVSLLRDCDLIGFVWQNRVWYYDNSVNLPYEVIPVLDDEGNLTYDESGCPVVQGSKTVVDEGSGVHDTQATPKHVAEDGSTVYGMAVDYTGSSIEPDVIGVSWTYSYVDEATGEQRQTTEMLSAPKYSGTNRDAEVLTYYGTAADLSTLRQSPNIEIGEDTGAITVAHGASVSQLFSNYWVVKFDIASEETFDLTKATVERYGDYVQYKSDTEAPYVPALDVVVGGRELAVYTEYDYEVVKTTAEDGTPDAEPCFAEGHKVYYRLVSKTDDSMCEIADPWIVQDFSMSRLSAANVGLVVKGEIDFSEGDFSPADHFDEYAEVVVKKNGNKLKRGFDYKLSSVSESINPYAAPDNLCFYASISTAGFNDTRGMVTKTQSNSNTLRFNDDEDLLKVKDWTITQELLDALAAQDKLAVTTSASGYFSRCNKLAWCSSGYTKDDVAAQLHLAFTYNSGMSMSPSYSLYPFTKVEKILDAEGREVEKLTDLGVYTLALSKGFEAPYANVAFDDVSIQVEVTAPQLSVTYDLGNYPFDWLSGGEHSNLQLSKNIFVSKSQKYAYTGEEVNLVLELKDVLGNAIDPSDYVVEAHGVDVGKYADWSVSATEKAQAANRLVGCHQAGSSEKYQITKADITSANIEIRVSDAAFTGAAVEPEVEFWDVTDSENPKKLAYKLGQDYTLAYENNVAIAQGDGENAPSVTITTQGSNMKAATKTVKFSIKGDLLDVNTVDFQYGQKLVQGSAPVVLGSYQTADGTKIDLEQGQAFTVTVCTDAEGTHEVTDLSSLAPGTQVYYRIDGVSANSFTGTKMLGPVEVVAASDANSFEHAQDAGSVLSVEVSSCTYTGAALTPGVTVKDNGVVLREGVDYTLAFENNVNAFVQGREGQSGPAPVVKVTGINGYAGEGSFSFDIQPAALDAVCTAVVADQTYTGMAIHPDASAVRVTFDGQPLEASGNWQVKADGYGEGNVSVGADAGTLTLVGVGNFAGELPVSFNIVGLALTADAFDVHVDGQTYTGEPIVPASSDVTITNKATGATLIVGTDYAVSGCANNLNAGTATLNVSGLGNYSGNMSGSFLIRQASLTQDMVSIGASSYPLSKDGVKPVPTVTLGSKVLPISDYAVTYGENNNPGKGTVTVAPVEGGNLSGEAVTIEFDITDDIAAATVNVKASGSYNASGVTPPVLEVLYGSPAVKLVEGVDYEVEYSSDKAAGTMTARIVGLGKFDGSSQEFEYSVSGKSLAAADVTVEIEQGSVEVEPGSFAHEYTGGEVRPAVTVKDGGVELVEGVDYELAYANNVAAGTAKVTVTAKAGGNYAEFAEAMFTIAPVDLDSRDVSIAVQPKSAFAGAPLEADVEVTHTPDVKGVEPISLVLNRDFALKYKNNDKPGLATVTITGMGNYAGEVDKTFPVEVDLKSASITPVKNVVFAGEPVDQAPEVKAGTYVLTSGVEYEVSYAAASDNGELNEDGLPCAPGSYLRKVSDVGGYVLGEVSEVFVVSAADDPSEGGNEPGDGGYVPGNPDGADNNPANPDGSASGNQGGSSTDGDRNANAEDASQSLAKTGDFNLIAVPVLAASALCAAATLALSRRKEVTRR